MTEFDLTSAEAAGSLVPDRTPPINDNHRQEQRDETHQDVSHRYGGPATRNQTSWPTGPTKPLPHVALTRPAIPAAREELRDETVELPPIVEPSPPARPRQRAARAAPEEAPTQSWDLVLRAQRGDSEAFAEIYHRYLDPVFRFIYFRVSNRQIAEDLTAETFLRALKRIGTVTYQGRDIGAWLITIARNLVADHFKSGRIRLETLSGDVLDTDVEDRGSESSPEHAVLEHITNVTLLAAVQRLNPEQRECIVLRFLQGFSVAETAQTMGKNEGAIKALQYRAVRALQRLLPDGFPS